MGDVSPKDIGQLKRIERIGRGAFSDVYCYENRATRQRVAVKVIPLHGADRRQINREVRIHRLFDHNNIVKLFAPVLDNDYAYLLMELCDGGTLFKYVRRQIARRLCVEEVRFLFRQMALAVEYVHIRGVIHRDIKTSNFMLSADRRNIKLMDFGLATRFEPGEMKYTSCGTPNYMAPEIVDKNVAFYNEAVDIWSLGCCFYYMLVGECPFERKTLEETFQAICKNQQNPIPTRVLIEFDDCAAVLMDQMLTVAPSNRISAFEILRHEFFKADD